MHHSAKKLADVNIIIKTTLWMFKEGKMSKINIKLILGPMRVPFLILAPTCTLLGVSTAVLSGAKINVFHLVLVFIGSILAHISVNALNEYFDFHALLLRHGLTRA